MTDPVALQYAALLRSVADYFDVDFKEAGLLVALMAQRVYKDD